MVRTIHSEAATQTIASEASGLTGIWLEVQINDDVLTVATPVFPHGVSIPQAPPALANRLPLCLIALERTGSVVAIECCFEAGSPDQIPLGPLQGRHSPDFLAGCRMAIAEGSAVAEQILTGIEAIHNGHRQSVYLEYESGGSELGGRRLAFLALPHGEGILLAYFCIGLLAPTGESRLEAGIDMDALMRLHSVNAFGADIAHSLSQPLTAITYYCEILQRFFVAPIGVELDSINVKTYAEQIAKQVERAMQIISDIRARARSLISPRGTVDIARLIRLVCENQLPRLAAHGVTLMIQLQASLPPVLGDLTQLCQALASLLINALEAVDHNSGERNITISAQQTQDGIQVSVADNGFGVSTDRIQTIFELFITDKIDHHGFGLGISRSIIRAHGGHLWYEANPSGGAIFHFLLPTEEPVS